MNYNLKDFGNRLLQIIEKRYLTRSEFARKAKADKNNLSLYCSGKKKAAPKTIVTFCAVLDCSPDWLTHGKGSIDDKFNLLKVDKGGTFRSISATRIDNLVEIRFLLPQQDFSRFIHEAQRDGCLS